MRLAIVLVLVAIVLVNAIDPKSAVSDVFDSWAGQHKKQYATDEERVYRFSQFQLSVQRIAALNKRSTLRGVGATYGLNKYSDLTPKEFADTILMKPFTPTDDAIKQQRLLTVEAPEAPDTFDWRNTGMVTAVKDQAQCGSCWAFSVTENVESVWMVAKGLTNKTMIPLAPQQIVDCDDSDAGCNGGNPPTAYEYIESAGGLVSEKSYPYKAEDGKCAFKTADVVATISNYKYATTNGDESILKSNLAAWAALSVCVDARYWQDYQSGIMTAYECDWIVELDHCVQAVGYDTTGSTPYWIMRNSWGTDWGEDGYIRLEYGQNTCGLTEEATSAVV